MFRLAARESNERDARWPFYRDKRTERDKLLVSVHHPTNSNMQWRRLNLLLAVAPRLYFFLFRVIDSPWMARTRQSTLDVSLQSLVSSDSHSMRKAKWGRTRVTATRLSEPCNRTNKNRKKIQAIDYTHHHSIVSCMTFPTFSRLCDAGFWWLTIFLGTSFWLLFWWAQRRRNVLQEGRRTRGWCIYKRRRGI